MRKIFRCLLLDLKKGMLSQWKRYLVCFLAVFGISFLNMFYMGWWITYNDPDNTTVLLSLGDSLAALFAGIDFYYPSSGMPFSLPVEWMFIILLALYVTLDYPLADLNTVGQNTLVTSASRSAWWLAKCFWVVISVLIFCLIVIVASCLATVCTGGVISFEIYSQIPLVLEFNTTSLLAAPWDIMPFLFVIPVMISAICLVQLYFSLLLRPIPGFGLMAIMLFFSAYCSNVLLPGEYLMAARCNLFIIDGYQVTIGFIFGFLLIVWAVLSSLFVFKRRDLLGGE